MTDTPVPFRSGVNSAILCALALAAAFAMAASRAEAGGAAVGGAYDGHFTARHGGGVGLAAATLAQAGRSVTGMVTLSVGDATFSGDYPVGGG
jgi:hypothetical protein